MSDLRLGGGEAEKRKEDIIINYITVNVLKFLTHKKKKKTTLNLFSLLNSEAKGSNKFCKGR